jgi:hypothetical protein
VKKPVHPLSPALEAAGLTLRVRGFGAAFRRRRSDERVQVNEGLFDNLFMHVEVIADWFVAEIKHILENRQE